jgi:hypothetical protein
MEARGFQQLCAAGDFTLVAKRDNSGRNFR